jgi:hypothetical protein
MGLLGATNLIYLALVGPLVGGAAWSMYRHGALPLLDLLDADEMLAAALNRLVTVGYTLFALGLAVMLTPNGHDVEAGAVPAVLEAVAGLLLTLGTLHLGLVGLFGVLRRRRALARDGSSMWVPPPSPPWPPQPPQPQPPPMYVLPLMPPPLPPPSPFAPLPMYAAPPHAPMYDPRSTAPLGPGAPPVR